MYFSGIESDEIFFLSSEVGILLYGVERIKNGGRAAKAEAKADPD
jgi:hypothetical protein